MPLEGCCSLPGRDGDAQGELLRKHLRVLPGIGELAAFLATEKPLPVSGHESVGCVSQRPRKHSSQDGEPRPPTAELTKDHQHPIAFREEPITVRENEGIERNRLAREACGEGRPLQWGVGNPASPVVSQAPAHGPVAEPASAVIVEYRGLHRGKVTECLRLSLRWVESSMASDAPPSHSAPISDQTTLDQLFTVAYEELRRLAAMVRRGDPSATLSPTALVNEAWLKLAASPALAPTSRLHFKRIAARAMRQILVEAARRRNAAKRGGGAIALVTFDDDFDAPVDSAEGILALDAALELLAQLEPRQAAMVESRFFAGLDIPETAAVLGVSEATVLRDWRAARAWLAAELQRAS